MKTTAGEIRSHRGPENYPKLGHLSQIFINPNRRHSALLLFPLSPKYFLVENQLKLTVYIFDKFRWELHPTLDIVNWV